MMTDQWNKSTYSNGNGGHCVEARTTTLGAAVRDTQNRELGHLDVPTTEWNALLSALQTK
ncbi:DUF397 domain-containing protein [Nocardiopsis alba]|jgi:hypothetical protein|uniref:DUF397 domain-containing protein n=1 Tax=Nocardiopsis alba TaxID=53437 RepID=UPI0033B23DE8